VQRPPEPTREVRVEPWASPGRQRRGVFRGACSPAQPGGGKGAGRAQVAHPDGTHRRELTAGYPIGSMPRFSPDGRQIAFISDNNVYVMDRDGHHKHKIADYSTLPDLDPTGGADAADVIWLGWQPLLTSPTAASSSRPRPEAPRSAVARIGHA
jgi:hypothetical protein